jgi:hypothetical protein
VTLEMGFLFIKDTPTLVGDTLILTWEFFAEDKLHDDKIEFVLN